MKSQNPLKSVIQTIKGEDKKQQQTMTKKLTKQHIIEEINTNDLKGDADREWKEYRLGEVYEFKSGLSKPRDQFGYGNGFVSFKDVFYNFFLPKNLVQLANTNEKEQETCSVKRGDVFLTRTSETFDELGMSSVALIDYDKATFNGFCKRLRPKEPNGILPEYIGYYFRSSYFRKLVTSMATMTTRASLNNEILAKLLVKYPPLPEQKAIANILGKLDDKIELNRQMNQTLEQMAQALFQSWFVDFDPVIDNALAQGNEIPEPLKAKADKRKALKDGAQKVKTLPENLQKLFPNTFVFNDTLNKWIPEGWEVNSLIDTINIIGGGTPKTSKDEYWGGKIPWFSVVDAPNDSDVFVIDTEKKVTQLGIDNSSTKILNEGTTIISARGTVGKCAIVGVPMAMNQSCYGVQSKERNRDIYTYLILRKNVSDLQSKSHGSVFSTITRDTFKTINVVIPNEVMLLEKFEQLLSSSFDMIKENLLQTQTLTQLRDALLPQLISGKLKVPEVMLQVEKALSE